MTDTVTVPADLGLPPKFTTFRSNQHSLAVSIACSEKRFSLLSMPTGGGKSLVYMTIARLLDARALVLVGTKGLQAQISADFQSLGLVDIRGQANYRCLALDKGAELEGFGAPGSTCVEGPCKVGTFCSLKHRGGCLYYDTIKSALKSQLVVSNYSYWLTIGRHADPMAIGKFDLLILDEAHSAPDWLAEHCTVSLERDEIKTLLGMDLPPVDEGVAVWSSWAKEAAIIAAHKYEDEKAELEASIGDRRKVVKRMLKLQSLHRDLVDLAQAHAWRAGEGPEKDVRMPGLQIDWVAQTDDKGAKFTPVWAHPYAESYLFRSIPKVVLSSATLTPAITKYLGINPGESDWHEVAKGFDPKRRPIIYVPTTRVDKNMDEGQVRVWVNRVDKIVGDRLDRKGIIATVSYARAYGLVERSRHSKVMLTHNSRTTREVVERYKRADPPAVLVSPSMVEGFDFPYELCRYIIICKLPFSDGRDPVEKARRKSDKEWSNYCTSLNLIQTSGRGMRAEDDMCEIFVIDDHWVWYRRAVEWPKWFREAWKQSVVAPPPLPIT